MRFEIVLSASVYTENLLLGVGVLVDIIVFVSLCIYYFARHYARKLPNFKPLSRLGPNEFI